MAWIKKIAHPDTGAIASYWDCVSVNWHKQSATSIFTVGGWANKAAYEANLKPVLTFTWEVPSGANPQLSTAADAFLSAWARQKSEFEGSVQVQE